MRQFLVRLVFAVLLAAGGPATCVPGEVELKNGMILEGTPVPIAGLDVSARRPATGPTEVYPLLMVEAGFKRYFFSASRRMVERVDQAAKLGSDVRFDLEHKRMKQTLAIQTLGPILDRETFDRFGRRTVTLRTPAGPRPIIQGITRITPQEVTVEGLNVVWEHGLATSSIDPPVLDPIIRGVTDQDKPNDRMSIALFYLQAGRYPECDHELEAIREKFPELEGRVDEISVQLRQFWADALLDEIDQRRRAGQHQLAYVSAKKFPTRKMAADVLRRIDEIVTEYDDAAAKGRRVVDLLARFQADMENDPRVPTVAPMRSVLKRELSYETLPRLEGFLNLADDDTLAPAEKLALAYSGWILGSQHAVTDLDATIRLWNARFLLTEYLGTDDHLYRERTLESLLAIEGVNVESLTRLIAELPPWLESSHIRPFTPTRVVAREAIGDQTEVAYHVLLPSEYDPSHRYPVIVALHPSELDPAAALEWWGVVRKFKGDVPRPGQSDRNGYIVIAPEYTASGERYDYGPRSHEVVVEAIRDARKRFRVDSNRVYLSGHGSGGDAAFDLAMSRPELFAGVIPVTGISRMYCTWYWPNSFHVPMFVVGGELDRDTAAQNANELTQMMKKHHDVVYCEYIGRGYESYFSEVHVLFDWMALHQRAALPRELDMRVLRPTDNRFYWLETYGLPPKVEQGNAALLAGPTGRRGITPATLEARINAGNGIDIRRSGGQRHVVWLSPDMLDFEKRVTIREKGRQQFKDFVEPSAETMLEDLRLRGDRERLFSVRIEFQ